MTDQEIIDYICLKFKVTEEQLKSSTRKYEVTLARHMAIYFIYLSNVITLQTAAETFNRHKHGTAKHAIDRIDDFKETCTKFRVIFEEVYRHIMEPKAA
jgi:chromosomal replication initiator protein